MLHPSSSSSMKLAKTGIAFRSLGNPRSLLQSARSAERAGFRSLWLVEVAEVDAMALASSVCMVTERIQVATGVANSYLRSPTLLAMSASTVSSISKGRFVLGVGAGYPAVTYTTPLQNDTPMTRLRETIQILRLCSSGDKVNFHGKLFDVEGFQLGARPIPKFPIFGAAMGLRTLEIVAELADGAVLMLPTLDYMKDARETVRRTLRRFSRRRSDFPIACHLVTVVSGDERQAERMAKHSVARYASIPVYRQSFVRMGFGEEVRSIERARARNPRDALNAVPTEMAERLIVYGTAEECVEKVSRFVARGVTHPIIYPYVPDFTSFPKKVDEAIRALAPYLLGQT